MRCGSAPRRSRPATTPGCGAAADGGFELLKGLDGRKDQSYFLHRLNQAQLARTLFPVGELREDRGAPHRRRDRPAERAPRRTRPASASSASGRSASSSTATWPTRRGRSRTTAAARSASTSACRSTRSGQRKGIGIGGVKARGAAPRRQRARALVRRRARTSTRNMLVRRAGPRPSRGCCRDALRRRRRELDRRPRRRRRAATRAKTRYRQADAACRAGVAGASGALALALRRAAVGGDAGPVGGALRRRGLPRRRRHRRGDVARARTGRGLSDRTPFRSAPTAADRRAPAVARAHRTSRRRERARRLGAFPEAPMYQPAHFDESRPEVLQRLIREHPFGLLSPTGRPALAANGDPVPARRRPGRRPGRAARPRRPRQPGVAARRRTDARVAGRLPGAAGLRLAGLVPEQGRARQGRADLELRDGAGARRAARRSTTAAWLRAFVTRLTDAPRGGARRGRRRAAGRSSDAPADYVDDDAAGHRRHRDRADLAGRQVEGEPEPAGAPTATASPTAWRGGRRRGARCRRSMRPGGAADAGERRREPAARGRARAAARRAAARCSASLAAAAPARPRRAFEDTMAQRVLACTGCHGPEGRAARRRLLPAHRRQAGGLPLSTSCSTSATAGATTA